MSASSLSSNEAQRRRYNEILRQQDTTIKNLRFANDDINRKLFVLNNRAHNVAEKCGFATFEEFEEVVANDPTAWNVRNIRKNRRIAEHAKNIVQEYAEDVKLHGAVDAEMATSKSPWKGAKRRRNVDDLYADGENTSPSNSSAVKSGDLRKPLTESPAPNRLEYTDARSPFAVDVKELHIKLKILEEKYDVLLAAKKDVEKRYKDDYKKWKSFKTWLLGKAKHDKSSLREADNMIDATRGVSETDVSRPTLDESGIFAGKGDVLTEIPLRLAPDTPDQETVREKGSPVTEKKCEGPRNSACRSFSRANATRETMMHSLPILFSPTRKFEEFDSPTLLGRQYSPLRSITPARSRSPSNMTARKSPLSKPKFVEGMFTRQGRQYAATSTTVAGLKESSSERERDGPCSHRKASDTINALFVIDTSKNNGVDFLYDEVVRGRDERRRLEGGDCDCCKEYYENLVPIPSPPRPPMWKSPRRTPEFPRSSPAHHAHGKRAAEHKKKISRHRHQWAPPTTPPDYWSIGFPTTQEAADINRRAEDMHIDKRRRIEKDVSAGNSRYVRRQAR